MSNVFSTVIAALKSAGVSATSIPSIIQSIGLTNTWSTQATALLNQIAAVTDNPAEVSRLALQIKELPGLPAVVASELMPLSTAGVTQLQVVAAIGQIESAIAASSSKLF